MSASCLSTVFCNLPSTLKIPSLVSQSLLIFSLTVRNAHYAPEMSFKYFPTLTPSSQWFLSYLLGEMKDAASPLSRWQLLCCYDSIWYSTSFVTAVHGPSLLTLQMLCTCLPCMHTEKCEPYEGSVIYFTTDCSSYFFSSCWVSQLTREHLHNQTKPENKQQMKTSMPQNIEEKGRWQLTFPDVPRTYHLSCFFCMLGHKTVDFVFSFALSVFFPFTYRFFFWKRVA